MYFIPVMVKPNFQAANNQSLVSHDPSEIILCWFDDARETFFIITVESSCDLFEIEFFLTL